MTSKLATAKSASVRNAADKYRKVTKRRKLCVVPLKSGLWEADEGVYFYRTPLECLLVQSLGSSLENPIS